MRHLPFWHPQSRGRSRWELGVRHLPALPCFTPARDPCPLDGTTYIHDGYPLPSTANLCRNTLLNLSRAVFARGANLVKLTRKSNRHRLETGKDMGGEEGRGKGRRRERM